jgi:branched-subunit amino acid aminotransferase/4-amino-4-deoxychorismate lyase
MEIDGHTPTEAEYRALAISQYGHFTAMGVRDGRTRGLDLHLARLTANNREMFGADLDPDLVRAHIRHALGDDLAGAGATGVKAALVRVLVVSAADEPPCVIVTVRPAGGPPNPPHTMRSVPYLRPLAHIKQIGGGFGQAYYQRIAQREGFAEALFTGPDGVIAEGAITNVGFVDGDVIVWPDAPCLAGITMQLLRAHPDLRHRCATVRLADLGSYQSVFITNARGIVPVGRIDDVSLPIDEAFMKTVHAAYDAVPWDRF